MEPSGSRFYAEEEALAGFEFKDIPAQERAAEGQPACQGKMIAKVEEDIAPDRTSKGMMFSKSKLHVVCPWHGFEFDIRTGVHPGNPKAPGSSIKTAIACSVGSMATVDFIESIFPRTWLSISG
jgi:hypothetical protein